MSRQTDPNLKTNSGYYKSRYENTKEYNKNYEQVAFRVIKGNKNILKDYVNDMHTKYPDDAKYSSLNAYLCALIKADSGLDLNNN